MPLALFTVTTLVWSVACGSSATSTDGTSGAALPLITPPVAKAAPSSLVPSSQKKAKELDRDNFRSRFFSGAGPTDVFQILQGVDDRLSVFNAGSSSKDIPCVSQPAVAYALPILGQTVDMYAQCYQMFDRDFVQFGKHDGVTYLYSHFAVGEVVAILTPLDGGGSSGSSSGGADTGDAGAGGDYLVHAFMSVGENNASSCGDSGTFDDCSYGVMEIQANSRAGTFEFAVAGIGMGFCGAQIASDGHSIFGMGSEDMGSTCHTADTVCTDAVDLSQPGSCGALQSFTVGALGRKAANGAHSSGASAYPAAPNVFLDGTANDSIHFGLTAPTPGAGEFL